MRSGSSRILIIGLVLLLAGGFFAFDSSGKLGWTPLKATVTSVDPKCEMKAEEIGVLSKMEWTSTIDCQLVEPFKVLHPDKTWTVRHQFLAHLRLGTPQPLATTMMLYDDPGPHTGQVLAVVQDPDDP